MLATAAAIILVLLAIPFLSLRLGSSDEGNNPPSTTTRKAYDLLAKGFGPGFNGPFTVAAATTERGGSAAAGEARVGHSRDPGVAAVQAAAARPERAGRPSSPSFPTTSPQAAQTTSLLHHLRRDVIPKTAPGMQVYVGGLTAIFADFTTVIDDKLPLFIGVVVGLAFLLLAIAFRSLLIPLTASVMQPARGRRRLRGGDGRLPMGLGRLGHRHRTRPVPVEPFLPVMMFAILFGLSMDYEVFLVSRMHEDWLHSGDNSRCRHPRPGRDRTGHHRRRQHHGAGLRLVRVRRRTHHQGVRDRPGDGHPDRRPAGANRAGAVRHASVRPVELVAPALARPDPARVSRWRDRTTATEPTTAGRPLPAPV